MNSLKGLVQLRFETGIQQCTVHVVIDVVFLHIVALALWDTVERKCCDTVFEQMEHAQCQYSFHTLSFHKTLHTVVTRKSCKCETHLLRSARLTQFLFWFCFRIWFHIRSAIKVWRKVWVHSERQWWSLQCKYWQNCVTLCAVYPVVVWVSTEYDNHQPNTWDCTSRLAQNIFQEREYTKKCLYFL